MARPSQPTGLTTEAFANEIKISWRQNPEADIKGYNIYNSQTSGGGVSGYTRLNDELIEIFSSVIKEVVGETENSTEIGNIRTTTTVEQLEQVFFFSYTHQNLEELREQFYVITAVNTNGEESLLSSEISDTPIVLNTEVVQIPRRTKADTIIQYIDEIFRHDRRIDTKPGTITRDIKIDPHGTQFEYVYILLDFYLASSSFVSLKEFDDSDGDRVSDEFEDNERKQQLRTALGYADDGSEDYLVQQIIDNAFDRLASNSFVTRKGATSSQGEVTFYSNIPPTSDVLINAGEIVSTLAGQNTVAINYRTLATAFFDSSEADSFFNSVNQRYELKVPIEAIETGESGNVGANTIISTSVSEFSVTNELSTFGGQDQEGNADLADRAILSYRSLDVGTMNGYRKNAISIQNVQDVEVIDAGHTLMQRDYEELLRKHIYGKVDVYFQGEELEEFTETFGFLFSQIDNELMSILQLQTATTNLIIQSTNADVSSNQAIFETSEIRNLSQSFNYDVLGNITVYVNGLAQTKGRGNDVEVNLTTGELVFTTPLAGGLNVTAKYDSFVEEETLISSAIGGETSSSLANTGDDGIRQNSYVIYKNETAMVETTEYTINLTSGLVTFLTPLSTGDTITAEYAYILNVETITSLTTAGERSFFVDNPPILPSVSFDDNGTDIIINRYNDINAGLTTNAGDSIEVTYRYRASDPIILQNQPVRSISSVVSSNSGTLVEGTHYEFNQQDDIILEGNSVKAQRSVQILYNLADNTPTGTINSQVDTVILSGEEYAELSFKGVVESSILVQNTSRSSTYIRNIDYTLEITDGSSPVKIARIDGGSILNGQSVVVDYNYGDIITIRYLVNNLVNKVQEKINTERHITADVLVKESPETKVNITLSVSLLDDVDPITTKDAVTTAISNEINVKLMGENLFRSDIIRAVDGVDGVDYVVLPLSRMLKADNTVVVREFVDKDQITFTQIPGTTRTYISTLAILNENSVSNGTFVITTTQSGIIDATRAYNITQNETYTIVSFTSNTITLSGTTAPVFTDVLQVDYYVRSSALAHSTNGNANNTTQLFGVYETDSELTLVNSEGDVDLADGQAFIASDGAVLLSQKHLPPNDAIIRVTYYIAGETGEKDIVVSDIEHLEPGEINVLIA